MQRILLLGMGLAAALALETFATEAVGQARCPAGSYACRGAGRLNVCCTRRSKFYCERYRGRNPQVSRGWSGCVTPANPEHERDFSAFCTRWLRC